MDECPRCGAEIAPDDNFCRQCGVQLGAEPAPRLSETVAEIAAEYRRQVRDNPDDAAARHSLGLAYLYGRDFAAAREQFESVVSLEPEFADAHAKLAVCLARLGMVGEARRAVGRALKLKPQDTEFQALADKLEAL